MGPPVTRRGLMSDTFSSLTEVEVMVVPSGAGGFTCFGPIVTTIRDVAAWNNLVTELADSYNESLAIGLAATGLLFAKSGVAGLVVAGIFAILAVFMYQRAAAVYSTTLARLQAHHAAIVAVIEECPEQAPVGGAENDTCQ